MLSKREEVASNQEDVLKNQSAIDSVKTKNNRSKKLNSKTVNEINKKKFKFLVNCKDDENLQNEILSLLERLNKKIRGSNITVKEILKYYVETISEDDIKKIKKRSWSHDDHLDHFYEQYLEKFVPNVERNEALSRSGWLLAVAQKKIKLEGEDYGREERSH